MNIFEKLSDRYKKINSLLCVGLDPTDNILEQEPLSIADRLHRYVTKIIGATSEYALIYKANVAYFEQYGIEGYAVLSKLRTLIPEEIPLILDAKRGDIGPSALAYSKALYDKLGADIITVNGYMGTDSISPFTDRHDKGVFILCKTSNPSGRELQNLKTENQIPLYLQIARLAQTVNKFGNVGLVVGATCPDEMATIRHEFPNMWILAPGIGTQGGDMLASIRSAKTSYGGILINAGRLISEADNPKRIAELLVIEMRKLFDKIDCTDSVQDENNHVDR